MLRTNLFALMMALFALSTTGCGIDDSDDGGDDDGKMGGSLRGILTGGEKTDTSDRGDDDGYDGEESTSSSSSSSSSSSYAGGGMSCEPLLNCVVECEGEVCVDQCIDDACDAALGSLAILIECVNEAPCIRGDSECLGSHCGWAFQDCAQQRC